MKCFSISMNGWNVNVLYFASGNYLQNRQNDFRICVADIRPLLRTESPI